MTRPRGLERRLAALRPMALAVAALALPVAAGALASACASGNEAVRAPERDEAPPERLRLGRPAADDALVRATDSLEAAPEIPPDRDPNAPLPEGVAPPPPPEPETPPPTGADEKEALGTFGEPPASGEPDAEALRKRERELLAGPLSRDSVAELFKVRRGEVQYCFERAVKQNKPDPIPKRVVVGFTILSDGRVSGARVVEIDAPHELVEPCLLRSVGAWRFPKPVGVESVEISYPLEFTLIE